MKDNTYFRGISFYGFAKFVKQNGGDARDLLEEVGIDPQILVRQNQYCSFVKFSELLELAAKKLETPTFGLDYYNSLPPHLPNVGPVIFLGHFCRTPREWFSMGLRYLPSHTNALQLSIEEVPEKGIFYCEMAFTPWIANYRQVIEGHFVLAQRLIHENLGNEYIYPLGIRFQLPKPSNYETLQTYFDCPITFDCPKNELVYDLRLLDQPLGPKFTALKPILNNYLSFMVGRSAKNKLSIVEQVESTIEIILGSGRCNLENVAQSIGIHPKKLQRELTINNEQFSKILERVRENIARHLLVETDIAVVRIAEFLDYAETAPFTLAFKRWSGLSPKKYREQMRAAQSKPGS